MPYLPESFLHETGFPKAFGKDLAMQARLIVGQYERFYPEIPYYVLEKSFDTPTDAPGATVEVVGVAGSTKFDTLWNEPVPDPGSTTWEQPHGLGNDLDATDARQFADVVYGLHGRAQRVAKQRQLKYWGFDEIRDLLVSFPTPVLDALGIAIKPGDEFVWDGDRFTVLQHRAGGYWKNSNSRLFRTCNCVHARVGS